MTGQNIQRSEGYQKSPSLMLRPAPGRTPSSSVLWLDAAEPAVFVGDVTHSPLQVRRPDDPYAFDTDPSCAQTRRRIFAEAATAGPAVIPAHYPCHGSATSSTFDEAFGIDRWLN
jgi:glyoxylase-like metal-dependent hydrolase (beta-lactamase superfamily II)